MIQTITPRWSRLVQMLEDLYRQTIIVDEFLKFCFALLSRRKKFVNCRADTWRQGGFDHLAQGRCVVFSNPATQFQNFASTNWNRVDNVSSLLEFRLNRFELGRQVFMKSDDVSGNELAAEGH